MSTESQKRRSELRARRGKEKGTGARMKRNGEWEREEERGVYASHRPRRVASLKARAMGARRLERRQSVLNCLSMRQPLRARLKPGSRWT